MAEKKSTDAFVLVTENGVIKRNVVTTPLQIGYPGNPAELQLTGKISHSLQVVQLKPGQNYEMDDSVTILCVKTTSGTGSVTVTLPQGTRSGQVCHVKDSSGTAATNNLVVSGGKYLIDGKSTRTLTNAYESTVLAWSGDSWAVIGGYEVGPQGPAGPTGPSGAAADEFVVAGGTGNNSLAYTTDGGLTWTGLGSDILKSCYNIAWNGTTWLAVGESKTGSNIAVAWSNDGINWTGVNNPFTTTYSGKCYCVAWSGKNWVIGGTNGAGNLALIAVSPDYPTIADLSSSWYVRYSSSIGVGGMPGNYTGIYGLTKIDETSGYVAAVGTRSSGTNDILVSSDGGTTWSTNSDPNHHAEFVWGLYIASNVGHIIAGGISPTIVHGYSLGGSFNLPTKKFGGTYMKAAAWNGAYWLVVGEKGESDGNFGVAGYSSDNGDNWASSGRTGVLSNFKYGNSACWTGKKWLIAGVSTSGTGILASSSALAGDSGWSETASGIFGSEAFCVVAKRVIPV